MKRQAFEKFGLKAETIDKYVSQGYWGTKVLGDYLKEATRRFPDKVAIADSRGKKLTYSEIDKESTRLAQALLNLGLRRGQVASVQLPNWAETVLVWWALTKIGVATNPVMMTFRHAEISHVLKLCESSAYIVPSEFRGFNYAAMAEELRSKTPTLRHVVVVGEPVREGLTGFKQLMNSGAPVRPTELSHNSPDANDPLVIFLTSGTESAVKAVVHTHNTIIYSEKGRAQAMGCGSDDTLLMASPITHAAGFLVTTMFLIQGGSVVLQESYNLEEFVRLTKAHGCTVTFGATPFLYDFVRLLDTNKDDLRSIRLFGTGGAPVPRQLVRETINKGIPVIVQYGSSESPPHCSTRPDDPLEKMCETDGKPVPGTEVKIRDENGKPLPPGVVGEEASRGPGVALGYFNNPELTSRKFDSEGWYYSGDLCVMDPDGYVAVKGRKSDFIIRGGVNISPREIEDILLQHPDIREAAVVGMPDERLGEKVCAYVVLQNRTSVTLEEVLSFLQQKRVGKHAMPERVEVIDTLPKTPAGKVKKFLLREDIRSKMARENN